MWLQLAALTLIIKSGCLIRASLMQSFFADDTVVYTLENRHQLSDGPWRAWERGENFNALKCEHDRNSRKAGQDKYGLIYSLLYQTPNRHAKNIVKSLGQAGKQHEIEWEHQMHSVFFQERKVSSPVTEYRIVQCFSTVWDWNPLTTQITLSRPLRERKVTPSSIEDWLPQQTNWTTGREYPTIAQRKAG